VVGGSILAELYTAVCRVEVLLVLRECELIQVVRRPQLFLARIEASDLCVELRGRADTHDIAVDDLSHADLSLVADHVEGLGLDICAVYDLPRKILPLQLGVGNVLRLLGDGLDGIGAIFALGDADATEASVQTGYVVSASMHTRS